MNFKKSNLVSVCIPTYNGASFLQEALVSIKKQTYPHIEVVVSDDASTDETLALVNQFKSEVPFPVTVVNHTPQGIGANWNHCIAHATGTYIKFLFQDDVLYPRCIEEMVAVYKAHPHLGLVACKRDFIVEGTETEAIKNWFTTYGNLQMQFEKEEPITFIDKQLFGREDFLNSPVNKIGEPTTVLFKKEIVEKVGFFDEQLKQVLDCLFFYRILKLAPIAIVNQSLIVFRIHANQATNLNRSKQISEYGIFTEILYNDFLPLLHSTTQKKLSSKFSYKAVVIKKIKYKIKRFIENKSKK